MLLLLGAGPASMLPRRFDAAARIALAPLLGFCLGTCVTTTLLEFFPAGDTYAVVVVLAVLSSALAASRTLRSPGRALPSLRDAAQLLVVCVAVTGPLTVALHHRATVGPAVYTYTDADNYVAVQQAAETTSLRDAREQWNRNGGATARYANFTAFIYASIADFGSNLDATPLHANVNALLGLPAIDTFGPFLIVLLLMGGLGLFGVVRRIAGEPAWMAVLTGASFGGALFLELWFDSYQAAIIALGLLVPAVLLGSEALQERRPATLALLALVLATLVSVYPLFLPPLIAIGGVAIVWQAVAQRRAGIGLVRYAGAIVGPLLAVGWLSALLNPVGLTRTAGYYAKVAGNDVDLPRVGYTLPTEVLPGWLLQTREFWALNPLDLGDPKVLALAVLLPALFVAFAAVAVRHRRFALALLGLAALFCLAAAYGYASRDACTYCAQRYLLALGPILAVLVALGLWHLSRLPSWRFTAVAIVGALLIVVAVGARTRAELDRFVDASFFFDTANRSALQALPRDGRPVHVEGYWASTAAQAEQPLVYHLATAQAPGRVSVSLGTDAGNALQYLNFGQVGPPGPEFRADYRYLLTRFSGVQTARRVVARRGAVALMERTEPLDVTPFAGLTIPQARIDSSGVPSLLPGVALGLYVVGPAPGRVWARLTFQAPPRLAVPRGVRSRQRADVLTVCVRAQGKAPVRTAALQLPVAGPSAVRLSGMRAVTGRCAP